MRLISVELENFRCFEKEKIDLHPQLNVFVGLNASGKTALLEGIAIVIGEYIEALTLEGLLGPKMNWSDRKINSFGKTLITCDAEFGPLGKKATWSSTIKLGRTLPGLNEEFSSFAEDNQWTARPVLLFFSTKRVWDSAHTDGPGNSGKLAVFPNLKGYYNALEKQSNTSFLETELEKEQKASQQSKELGYEFDSSRLNLVRTLAVKVLQDCEIFYFDYEKEMLSVKFKDGKRLTLSELSDGQKSLLLISAGIAFQCATLNPHMGLDAYKSSGVVLIDEVELHLHPEWQRQILPILTREFPNIQFICTTHSPQVLSTLKPEHVQVIKDFKVKPLRAFTEGRDTNAILMDVFGVEIRPKEFEDKLQHFYALLEKEDVEAARLVFDDLEHHWGPMDTEIVRARYYLEDLMADLTKAKEATK